MAKEPAAAVPLDAALCQLAPREAPGSPADKAVKKKARAQLLASRRACEASDYAASLKALRESYATEPTLDTLFNIAQTCREAEAAAEAIPLHEFTLKNSEDDAIKADCQHRLGTLRPKVAKEKDAHAQKLLPAKQFTDAIQAWEQACKLDPQPAYLLGLATAQRQGGQAVAAISTYERLSAVSSADDVAKEARAAVVKLRTEQAELRAQRPLHAGDFAQAFGAWQDVPEEKLAIDLRFVVEALDGQCRLAQGTVDYTVDALERFSVPVQLSVLTNLNSAPTMPALTAVHGSSQNNVWAVSTDGRLVRWDGCGWSIAGSVTSKQLNAVHVAGPDEVWAAGDDAVVVHYAAGTLTALPATIQGAPVQGTYKGMIVVDAGRLPALDDTIVSIWGDSHSNLFLLYAAGAGISAYRSQGAVTPCSNVSSEINSSLLGARSLFAPDPSNVFFVGTNGLATKQAVP